MVMKLHHEICGALISKDMDSIWNDKFISLHERVILEQDAIDELQKGLKLCQLLQLPSTLICSHNHLVDLLAKENDATLRPFSHLK